MLHRTALVLVAFLLCAHTTAFGQSESYVPARDRADGKVTNEGTQLVMMYFGASFCGPCHAEGVKEAVSRAKVLLLERAKQTGKNFAAVGVAQDKGIERGMEFLRGNGAFDEVVIGRSLFNSAALDHTFGRGGGGLPTIVVYERDITFPTPRSVDLSKAEYKAEVTGSESIVEWVESDAPLE